MTSMMLLMVLALVQTPAELEERLLGSIEAGDVQGVKDALTLGANRGAKTKDGMPALVLAAESGQDAIVQVLLNPLQPPALPPFGLSSTDAHQRTALLAAASNGHRSTALLLLSTADQHVRASVELIIKRGSNLEFEPGQGIIGTAVAAADFRSTLLNKPDDNNTTALMMAAAHGWQDVVEMMLRSGADPRVKNNNGYTASMIAANDGYTALSDYLRAAEQKQ